MWIFHRDGAVSGFVLIETLWNVNIGRVEWKAFVKKVLIETLWNVNDFLKGFRLLQN